MALGPGENEFRKLQSTGGSTFTVSLPKPWVLAQGLSARDSLRMDWRPSGALRVTPLNGQENMLQQAFFSTQKLPENSLHDHLMGAYISGSDEMHIKHLPEEAKEVSMQVRRFLRSTRGFEIMDESPTSIQLRCLLNAGDMPLHASLNRMYLQVTSLTRDILSVFEGESREYLTDAEERENEVDALLYLIDRQVRILLDSHLVATRLNLTRTQAVEYANLARSLERMMDHAYSIASLILENPKITKNMIAMTPLEQLPIWRGNLKELMINIRTRDSTRIEKARSELKEAQRKLIEHEQDMLKHHRTNEWMAFDLRLSESIRRLCAYARDFGEILLNMKVFNELHRIRT
jgi:phosphate uptake regulator